MNYIKLNPIGSGGFGQVFCAIDTHGNKFALKELDISRYKNDAALAENITRRFKQEATKQAEIRHENVIRVVDVNLNNVPPFFVMELGAHTFKTTIENYKLGTGNFKEIKTGLFNVLSGLSALHEIGIWHRDLKPQNILFVNPDKFAISDFGLIAVRDTDATTLTMTGTTAGTSSYSPPEFMRDFKKASAESDIYSFGAILHDVFVRKNRVPYSELRDGIGKIGEVIAKCTKLKTYDRYRNVEDLRSDLFEAIAEFESSDNAEVATTKFEFFSNPDITEGNCDEIIDLIDSATTQEKVNIFKSLTPEFIERAYKASNNATDYIAEQFANHVIFGTFDFNYCDVLADRLMHFFQRGSIGTQSICLLALLVLGTSHNRWYVENRFVRNAGPDRSDAVIRRLILDAKANNVDLNGNFAHLFKSVTVQKEQLHHLLALFINT